MRWVQFPGGLCLFRYLYRQPQGTCTLCPALAWGLARLNILHNICIHVCSASKLPAESSYSCGQIFLLPFFFPASTLVEKKTQTNSTQPNYSSSVFEENKDGIITQRVTSPLLYFLLLFFRFMRSLLLASSLKHCCFIHSQKAIYESQKANLLHF